MLTASDMEAAFIETARQQTNGQPFDWARLAHIVNDRLADQRDRSLAETPAFRFSR
jgi:hypothetical protein